MERVADIELAAVQEKRPSDVDAVEREEPRQERRVLTAERRVLAQKAVHDRLGRVDRNATLLQYLLERPRIVVGVAVRQYDRIDQARTDPGTQQPFGGVDRRIDHDSVVVEPDDESRGVVVGVEPVAGTQAGDAEPRRLERGIGYAPHVDHRLVANFSRDP